MEDLLEEAGGHPMAAGFTIKTTSITPFTKKLNKVSIPLLTDKILTKTLSIDMEINFDSLTETLAKKLTKFEPTGYGNTTPRFVSCDVEVLESKTVGKEARHLKMVLRQKEKVFDTIAFGMGDRIKDVLPGNKIDVVYALEENEWNGVKNLQLRVKDVE